MNPGFGRLKGTTSWMVYKGHSISHSLPRTYQQVTNGVYQKKCHDPDFERVMQTLGIATSPVLERSGIVCTFRASGCESGMYGIPFRIQDDPLLPISHTTFFYGVFLLYTSFGKVIMPSLFGKGSTSDPKSNGYLEGDILRERLRSTPTDGYQQLQPQLSFIGEWLLAPLKVV